MYDNCERLIDKGIINRPLSALDCFRLKLEMSETGIQINLENLKKNPGSKFLRKEILRGLKKRRAMKNEIKKAEDIINENNKGDKKQEV